MEFGKVNQLNGILWQLPPTPSATTVFLSQQQQQQQQTTVHVGCPVWAQPAWRGTLYPAQAKSADFLYYYARQFSCIELNTTHYRIPELSLVRRWVNQTPDHFLFCPKIPQEISHRHQLRHAEALTVQFVDHILGLGQRLGLCFLQLPPQFGPDQATDLWAYLQHFPEAAPLAVEFRDKRWFDGSAQKIVDQTLDRMRERGIATVITDVAGRRDVLHHHLTASTVAVRFVGNGLHPTDFTRVDAWAQRLSEWLSAGLSTVYFWVHEPDNVQAPTMARYAIQQFNQVIGLEIPEPLLVPLHPGGEQGSLF